MPLTVKGRLNDQKAHAIFSLSANQTTNIDAGDHIKFDTVHKLVGTGITLDTSTPYVNTNASNSIGRFLLKAGRKYRISAVVAPGFSAAGLAQFCAYQADAGTLEGASASPLSVSHAQNVGSTSMSLAIVEPSNDTRYEIRIQVEFSMTSLVAAASGQPATYVEVEEL